MIQKVPPHSTDAEVAVLSVMIADPKKAIDKVIEILDDDCFYNLHHRTIFAAIKDAYLRDVDINLLTITEELKRTNKLEDADGVYYVSRLLTLGFPLSGLMDSVRIVFEYYIKRWMIADSRERESRCFDVTSDAFAEISDSEYKLTKLTDRLNLLRSTETMESLSADLFNDVINAEDGLIINRGLLSGFRELDDLTHGFKPGELVIIAARPSMGKSAIALNIAANVAKKEIPIGIFSLEMTARSLHLRMVSSAASISSSDISLNRLTYNDKQNLTYHIGDLASYPIFIDDSPELTILSFKAKAKRMKKENNVEMIIIDYLQLMKPPKAGSREEQISIMSRMLKTTAKELEIPIIALAQLNREVEKRPNKTPVLSDLRESGSLEQDADIVLLLNRMEYYGVEYYDDGLPTRGTAQVIVAKNREGATGTARLQFTKEFTRFDNRY